MRLAAFAVAILVLGLAAGASGAIRDRYCSVQLGPGLGVVAQS